MNEAYEYQKYIGVKSGVYAVEELCSASDEERVYAKGIWSIVKSSDGNYYPVALKKKRGMDITSEIPKKWTPIKSFTDYTDVASSVIELFDLKDSELVELRIVDRTNIKESVYRNYVVKIRALDHFLLHSLDLNSNNIRLFKTTRKDVVVLMDSWVTIRVRACKVLFPLDIINYLKLNGSSNEVNK